MSLPNSQLARCAVCGRIGPTAKNHVGGQHHLAWFTMPFCSPQCHDRFHAMVRQAGIDLEFTPDNVERIRRALAAIKIAEWMLLEQLKVECDQRHEATT